MFAVLCLALPLIVVVAYAAPVCNQETQAAESPIDQRAARFIVTDCDTPSSGSPPPPPPPGRFNAVFNDVWITEFENPLARFQTLVPPADTGTRRVVNLPAVPYTAGEPAAEGTIISITDASIAANVDTFALEQEEMAQDVRDLLAHNPALQAVADTAAQQILQGAFHDAVQTLMATDTPADVTYWCGANGSPVYVEWVVVIPVTISCQENSLTTTIAVVTNVLNVSTEDPQIDPSGTTTPAGVELAFLAASTSTSASRYVTGFSFGQWGLGADTTLGKSWSMRAKLDGLGMGQSKRADVNWSSGLPDAIPQSPLFKAGDSLLATYEADLTRGTALRSLLDKDMLAGGAVYDMASGALRESFQMTGTFDPMFEAALQWHEILLEFPDGTAIAGRAAELTAPLDLRASTANPLGGIQHLVSIYAGTQRANITADTAEVKFTYYRGNTAVATVHTLAIPEEAYYLFDDGAGLITEPSAHIDIGGKVGYFRTALITSHLSVLDTSVTGDYAKRVFTMGGSSPDLITPQPKPWNFHGGSLPTEEQAHWARILSAKASAWDAGSYLNATDSKNIPNLAYQVGFPPSGPPSDVTSDSGTPIPASPASIARYLWGTNTYTDPQAAKACPTPLRIDGYCR